jgi:hypothetical protein
MWDPDNFPGADNVPWQLLIRARYAHELDAILASVVVARVGAVASVDITQQVAAVAQGVNTAEREKATSATKVRAMSAAADFDDWWCGTPWPRHWPPKPHRVFDDLSDPIAGLVIEQALTMVRAGGSEALQKSLGDVLAEVGGLRG